ncbi:MAG: AAA family ATPase [Candidatus Heimdallarchaeota archaeon]|nr:AAA family ATPase [Candidatus Heimdallarchaeota archaeon]MCK4954790.1 AAA family ATPase [Candidatus Heimdallarchaeota archaeon]
MTSRKIKVIAVTGMPGSGKSVFAEYANSKEYRTVVMGDVIRAAVIEKGLDPTPEMTRQTMVELRNELGETAVAYLTCKTINRMIEDGVSRIIIDGIRSKAEVEYFIEHLGEDFAILAIHVDPAIRYERLRLRARKDAPESFEDFSKRDDAELKLGLGETITFSNFIISNNGSLEEFKELSFDLLRELEKEED